MKLNTNYCLSSNNGESYLVNVENGDVFLINNVLETIVILCEQYETSQALTAAVYELYKNTEGDCTMSDLNDFIEKMIEDGLLIR